jgi:hypothetical protein
VSRTLKVSPFTNEVIFTSTAAGAISIPAFIIDTNYNYTVAVT